MPAPATGPLRLLRAGAVAVVTVALAALAHVAAGGGLPPFVVVVTLTALVLAAAVALTARRVGRIGALALLGGGQVVVHSAFGLVTTMACVPGPDDQAALFGHVHHAGMVMQTQTACAPADQVLAAPLLGASAMLVLHVVATVVAALVLAGADRALWWLAAWLAPLLGVAAPAVVVPRPALPTPVEVPWSGYAWWRDAVPLRGPPAWQSPVVPRADRSPRGRAYASPPPRHHPKGSVMPSLHPARASLAVAAGLALALVPATAASAHVRVVPEQTTAGGWTVLTFRVPNESTTAATSQVTVDLPTGTPLLSVSTRPLPGWTASVETAPLPEPVDFFGTRLTEAPARVVWTADPGAEIGDGQFQEFEVSTGPLPDAGTRLVLPAHQTYTDGTVVDWADVAVDGADEPEHPAPELTTTEAVADAATADPVGADPDPLARSLGAAGLTLGTVAVVVAVLGRRRHGDA